MLLAFIASGHTADHLWASHPQEPPSTLMQRWVPHIKFSVWKLQKCCPCAFILVDFHVVPRALFLVCFPLDASPLLATLPDCHQSQIWWWCFLSSPPPLHKQELNGIGVTTDCQGTPFVTSPGNLYPLNLMIQAVFYSPGWYKLDARMLWEPMKKAFRNLR